MHNCLLSEQHLSGVTGQVAMCPQPPKELQRRLGMRPKQHIKHVRSSLTNSALGFKICAAARQAALQNAAGVLQVQQKVPPHFKRCNGVTGRLQCAASEASGALLYTIAKIVNPTLLEGMHQATRHQRRRLRFVETLGWASSRPQRQSAHCMLASRCRGDRALNAAWLTTLAHSQQTTQVAQWRVRLH